MSFYYHWLKEKLIWSISRIDLRGKSKQRWGGGKVREVPAATGEARLEVTSHEPLVKYRIIEIG